MANYWGEPPPDPQYINQGSAQLGIAKCVFSCVMVLDSFDYNGNCVCACAINVNIHWEHTCEWGVHGKIMCFLRFLFNMFSFFFRSEAACPFLEMSELLRQKTFQNMATYSAFQFAGWVKTYVHTSPCTNRK